MNVVIIPARGGSKRIPRKNIKYFCGKPIIAWSIEVAKASNCFDRILVSTDDEEIADIARKYGASVPFIRPARLSNDFIGTTEVITHAVKWLNDNDDSVAKACCLYATAPFVQSMDLQKSLEQLNKTKCAYVISVTSYAFPIQRAIRIASNNTIEMFRPEYFNARSQDLEKSWHDAGQFYWGNATAWLEGKKIFSNDTLAYKIPRFRALDIDTMEDWEQAELIFKTINFK